MRSDFLRPFKTVPKTTNALKSIDPQKLAQGQMSQLSQEQLDQLREAMKKAAAACARSRNGSEA